MLRPLLILSIGAIGEETILTYKLKADAPVAEVAKQVAIKHGEKLRAMGVAPLTEDELLAALAIGTTSFVRPSIGEYRKKCKNYLKTKTLPKSAEIAITVDVEVSRKTYRLVFIELGLGYDDTDENLVATPEFVDQLLVWPVRFLAKEAGQRTKSDKGSK